MFKLLGKRVKMVETAFNGMQPQTTITYKASFWEAPEAAGETGRYVVRDCTTTCLMGKWSNVSRNVSFFDRLERAL